MQQSSPSPSPHPPHSSPPFHHSSPPTIDPSADSDLVHDPSDSHSKDSATPKSDGGFLHHIAYPVSYTFSGLLRRLSADEAPTALARALSANYNGTMSPSALFDAPKRRLSPFQPPPLTPLTLEGYKEGTTLSSRLLEKALAEEIRLLMPPRIQLVDEWKLVYSLEQNGTSLGSLYSLSETYRGKRGGFVLVIRDASRGVRLPRPESTHRTRANLTRQIFGAYLSDPPHPHAHYYGTGECFLWSAFRLPSLPDLSSLPPPPSADTTNLQRSTTIAAATKKSFPATSLTPTTPRSGTSTPDRIRFKAFPYTGENDFTIFCQHGFLSVGGGDGRYGLWLDNNLARGISSPCPTFGNENLSDEGEKFDILGVELWYIGS